MKIINYIIKQVQVIKEDPKSIFRKILTLISYFKRAVFFPINFFFFLIIILIGNFILIRIGFFKTKWVGELVMRPEMYLQEKKKNNNKSMDIFIVDNYVSNNYFFLKIKKNFFLINKNFNDLLKLLNFLSDKNHYFKKHLAMRNDQSVDYNQIRDDTKTEFFPTQDEINKGNEILNKNIKKKYKGIVLFCVRNNFYYDKVFPARNWNFSDFRNYDFKDFMPAANFLTSKGYLVLRMGKDNKFKIETENDLIIDYSFCNWKSDFMDYFLGYSCNFCISTGTGMDIFARLFRKPMGIVQNPISDIHYFHDNWTYIFGCIKNKLNNKYLNINEICEKMGSIDQIYKIKQTDFILEKNNSEDILDLVAEVEKKYQNEFLEEKYDDELQNKFWKIFFKYNKQISEKPKINFLICNSFLKKKNYIFKINT